MNEKIKVFGISGWKNAGKTTLTSALISEMSKRGLSVSSIKHAHHEFDVDHEGTDSFKHRISGAKEVLISSSKRYALMHEIASDEDEPDIYELLDKMTPVDLILVEGFKSSSVPKIQVTRSESLANAGIIPINNIVALATDVQNFDSENKLPQFALDDIPAIADFILDYLKIS